MQCVSLFFNEGGVAAIFYNFIVTKCVFFFFTEGDTNLSFFHAFLHEWRGSLKIAYIYRQFQINLVPYRWPSISLYTLVWDFLWTVLWNVRYFNIRQDLMFPPNLSSLPFKFHPGVCVSYVIASSSKANHFDIKAEVCCCLSMLKRMSWESDPARGWSSPRTMWSPLRGAVSAFQSLLYEGWVAWCKEPSHPWERLGFTMMLRKQNVYKTKYLSGKKHNKTVVIFMLQVLMETNMRQHVIKQALLLGRARLSASPWFPILVSYLLVVASCLAYSLLQIVVWFFSTVQERKEFLSQNGFSSEVTLVRMLRSLRWNAFSLFYETAWFFCVLILSAAEATHVWSCFVHLKHYTFLLFHKHHYTTMLM